MTERLQIFCSAIIKTSHRIKRRALPYGAGAGYCEAIWITTPSNWTTSAELIKLKHWQMVRTKPWWWTSLLLSSCYSSDTNFTLLIPGFAIPKNTHHCTKVAKLFSTGFCVMKRTITVYKVYFIYFFLLFIALPKLDFKPGYPKRIYKHMWCKEQICVEEHRVTKKEIKSEN